MISPRTFIPGSNGVDDVPVREVVVRIYAFDIRCVVDVFESAERFDDLDVESDFGLYDPMNGLTGISPLLAFYNLKQRVSSKVRSIFNSKETQ